MSSYRNQSYHSIGFYMMTTLAFKELRMCHFENNGHSDLLKSSEDTKLVLLWARDTILKKKSGFSASWNCSYKDKVYTKVANNASQWSQPLTKSTIIYGQVPPEVTLFSFWAKLCPKNFIKIFYSPNMDQTLQCFPL